METDTLRNKGSTERPDYTAEDIVEKAEVFNTLSLSDKEQFLKLVNPKFKDRIIAESMKNNKTKNSFLITDMANNKNKGAQNDAAAKQKSLDDAAVVAAEQAAAAAAAEAGTTVATTSTGKTRAPMVLDMENPGHKIIAFLRYLKRIAASTDYNGWKTKEGQPTSGEDFVVVQKRKIDGLMRRLYENKGGKITAAMHAKSSVIANRTVAEFKEDGSGLADVAKRSESILNEIAANYEMARTGGPGRSAAEKLTVAAPPKNFFGGMKF